MTIIALKLLTEASARGWTFRVDQGDDDGPLKVTGGKKAWQAVKEVGEAGVTFWDDGKRIGWAYFDGAGAGDMRGRRVAGRLLGRARGRR